MQNQEIVTKGRECVDSMSQPTDCGVRGKLLKHSGDTLRNATTTCKRDKDASRCLGSDYFPNYTATPSIAQSPCRARRSTILLFVKLLRHVRRIEIRRLIF